MDLNNVQVRGMMIRRGREKLARQLGKHTKQEWLMMVEEFGNRCVRCWTYSDKITKDHTIPIYQGGSDSIENIQPLCKRCNSQKGSETINWKEFRRFDGHRCSGEGCQICIEYLKYHNPDRLIELGINEDPRVDDV